MSLHASANQGSALTADWSVIVRTENGMLLVEESGGESVIKQMRNSERSRKLGLVRTTGRVRDD
jgi:hypothetical protein